MALTDLFRPRYKNSDPQVRKEAISELDPKQTDVLSELAASDEVIDVRVAAANRIEDRTTLENLAKRDNDLQVLNVITAKLDEIQRGVALGNADATTRVAAVHLVREEKILADLAETADCADVRTAAVQRLSCERLLARVARASCGRETAEAAVERITEEALLERVAKKGGNKAARKTASAKLAEIHKERNKPTVQQIREKELSALTDEAESLARSYNWLYAAECFEKWKERWATLDCNDQFPELHKRFNISADYFDGRYKEFQERQAAEEAAKKELDAALATRQAQVDAVGALQGQWGEESDAAIETAEAAWGEIEPLDHADAKKLEAQFNAGIKSYKREAARMSKSFADAEARKTAAIALQAQADAVADVEDPAAAKDACKELRKGLKAIGPAGDDEEVVAAVSRAETVLAALQEKVDAAKEAMEAEEKARTEKAEAHIAAIEALMDAEKRRAAGEAAKKEIQAFKELGQVPRAVHARFKKVCDAFYDKQREFRQEIEWEEFGNRTLAEELAKKAESLAGNNDLPKVAKLVRQLRQAWKANGHLGPDGQAVWERFNNACVAASERTRAWFEEKDAERKENLAKKQDLCLRAEQLAESTNWRETIAAIKELQAEWKTVGHVPKADSDAIWGRFRAACDLFFNRMRASNEERDRARQPNAEAKEALAAQAEELSESDDWKGTANKLKELQRQWKEIGPAPRRKDDQALWERFHGACEKFFGRLTAVKPDNLITKKAMVTEAQELVAEATDDNRDAIASKLMELQKRWKEVGPVPPEESEAVWDAFHAPIDEFFKGRKEEQERNAEVKQGIIAAVVEYMNSDDWRDAAMEIKAAQKQWKAVGHAGEAEKELFATFRGHCDKFFKRRDNHQQVLERNLREKEEICARLETLAGVEVKTPKKKQEEEGLDLAAQLQMAFETNFISAGSNSRSSKDAERQEVQSLQRKWREIGPVPHRVARAVNERFRRAGDTFFEQTRPKRPEVPQEEANANGEQLEALVAKAQELAASEPAEQTHAIKGLIRDWRNVGPVNNGKKYKALRGDFDGACDTIFEAAREREEIQQRF